MHNSILFIKHELKKEKKNYIPLGPIPLATRPVPGARLDTSGAKRAKFGPTRVESTGDTWCSFPVCRVVSLVLPIIIHGLVGLHQNKGWVRVAGVLLVVLPTLLMFARRAHTVGRVDAS